MMDIHRVGVSVPLSGTPSESVAPKEAPSSQPISQPFQSDALVSYTRPGLDLGSSPASGTTPPPGDPDAHGILPSQEPILILGGAPQQLPQVTAASGNPMLAESPPQERLNPESVALGDSSTELVLKLQNSMERKEHFKEVLSNILESCETTQRDVVDNLK
jgi:hypothetical protein